MILFLSCSFVWGCSRPVAESAKGPGDPEKVTFLHEVVRVRAQMGADDLRRIPAMIRREDGIMMTDQVVRVGRYRMAISKLDPANVDPKVVKLRQGMEELLDAYRFMCLNTAELFREVKAFDSGYPDRAPLAPALLSSMRLSRGNTVEALDSLLDALGGMDTSARKGGIDLAPIINSIRSDRARLGQALEAEQELARQLALPAGS